jgi:hypothetical protein
VAGVVERAGQRRRDASQPRRDAGQDRPGGRPAGMSDPRCSFESRSKKLDTVTNICSNECVRVCSRAPRLLDRPGEAWGSAAPGRPPKEESMSELSRRGEREIALSEPAGRGGAWTEERGTSDEGRRRPEAPLRRAGGSA